MANTCCHVAYSALFSGEVDCCQTQNGETKYVELKTHEEIKKSKFIKR